MNRFEFSTAQRIVFGSGTFHEAMHWARSFGRSPLLVSGKSSPRSHLLGEQLQDHGCAVTSFSVTREPILEDIRQGCALVKAKGCDSVIALGGGSVMDAGKAIAALAVNPGDPLQYLEVIGQGRALEHRPLPLMVLPTTAGTGAEATRNAVIASVEHGVKVSLRHDWLLPRLAVVDPELTLSLPPEMTASTGMDALTQLVEPFLSSRANPLTDLLCEDGLQRVSRSLQRAWENGQDLAAREDMSMASLLGGMALANAGLGAVHGLAGPLGGLRPIPHGVACAALLPHVLEANHARARESGQGLVKWQRLASLLTGNPEAFPEDGIAWVKALAEDLQIPSLSTFGLATEDLEGVAERAQSASSMKGNPVPLSMEDLLAILRAAL